MSEIDLDAYFGADRGDQAREPAGLVALVGRPNVGKSTLLNRLIGEKLSITSRKAQTTRHRIMGVRTDADAQYVFVDTPGFQTKHSSALNRTMNRGVTQALQEVDVICLVIEADRYGEQDRKVVALLPDDKPVILVLNKIDQIKDKTVLLPFISKMADVRNWAAVVPVSAEKGTQAEALLTEIRKALPCQGFLYAPETLTDRSERFIASEYIREKLFRLLGDELPYAATVEIEKFEIEGDLRRIFAAIVVDRESHKPIIIGKNGETLKRIATEARQDMTRLFGGTVYLELWVKVKSGWSDDERLLRTLGYE